MRPHRPQPGPVQAQQDCFWIIKFHLVDFELRILAWERLGEEHSGGCEEDPSKAWPVDDGLWVGKEEVSREFSHDQVQVGVLEDYWADSWLW